MKRILLLAFILFGFNSFGQTATTIKTAIDGTITNVTADKAISGTTVGTRMKEVVDFADKNVKAADSVLKYVTPKRLADSTAAVRLAFLNMLADSAQAIRDDFPAGGGGGSFRPYAERWVSQIEGIPTDGVTSVAAYIQPVLDSASIFKGLKLHWDIPLAAIDSELRVKSNTIIEGVGLPYVKLMNNVRQPLFINHGAAPGAPMVDSNITIKNFYLDGNAFNNIDSVFGYASRDQGIITGITMAGVKGVRLDNITLYQTNGWGIAFCNVDYSHVSNLTGIRDYNHVALVDVPSANWKIGKVPLSMDLINYRGGCEFGYWENLRSNSPDDILAINGIFYDTTIVGGMRYMNYGAVHDIYGSGLFCDSAALGFAVYSSQTPVYNIGINNVYGTVQHRYGYAGSNSAAIGAIPGYQKGDICNLSVTNVNIKQIPARPNTFDYDAFGIDDMFWLDANIRTLKLDNVTLNKWDRYYPGIYLGDNFTVNNLSVSNYTESHDKDTTLNLPRVIIDGNVKNGSFNNVQFSRAYNLPQAGKFFQADSANNIVFNNVIAYNIDTFSKINGVGVKNIAFNGITMDSCATDGAVIEITNALATAKVSSSGAMLGVTRFATGLGASNTTVKNVHFGHSTWVGGIDWPTPTDRYIENNPSAGLLSVGAPTGGYLEGFMLKTPNGTYNNGISWLGAGNSITSVHIGGGDYTTSYTNAPMIINGQTAYTNKWIMSNLGNITQTGGLTMGGALSVTGTSTLGDVTTITGSSHQNLTLRRPLNNATGLNTILFKLYNASNTYVDYGQIGASIVSNTAGSHNGGLDFSIAVSGTLTSKMTLSSADLTLTTNLSLSTLGNKLKIKIGSNASFGTATLASGTVTVSTTAVTANSQIFVTHQGCASCGTPYISAKTAGTSFTITSSNASDASTVAWWIVDTQ